MKKQPTPDRRRRIAQHYRAHLDDIALIYVRAAENKTESDRRVRAALPHLKGFKPARFDAWQGNPEWQAAVDSARLQATAEKALPPEVRGARLLQFARTALHEIEEAYVAAKAEADEKEKASLEARIIKLHDALRSEERHQDNIKTQVRLRDFAAFIANVIALLKGLPAEFEHRLREAMADPAKLMGITIE